MTHHSSASAYGYEQEENAEEPQQQSSHVPTSFPPGFGHDYYTPIADVYTDPYQEVRSYYSHTSPGSEALENPSHGGLDSDEDGLESPALSPRNSSVPLRRSVKTSPGWSRSGGASGSLYRDLDRRGYPVDWNFEFQRLLELPEDTTEQRLKKYLDISALSKDFVAMAERWGKIIIEEAFLAPQYRTIDPIDVGGQAGGEKYFYNGPFPC